jgi:hypothetical protein
MNSPLPPSRPSDPSLVWLADGIESLEDPALIMTMTGWIDAGNAAALALGAIVEEIDGKTVAVFDDDTYLDFRAHRPIMQVRDGLNTLLDWQRITVTIGTDLAGHDLIIISGPEPDMAWNRFSSIIAELAAALHVRIAIGLGAYPFTTPHTRPSRLSITTASADVLRASPLLRSSVDVPAGVMSLLEHRLHDAGIKAQSIWAQVPHYIANGPYPPAALALIDALRQVGDVVVDAAELRQESLAHRARLDELVANNADHQRLLGQLETVFDQQDPPFEAGPRLDTNDIELASGDEIAEELERFLREQE